MMDDITFEIRQKLSFDILEYLDSFCKNNDIKYYLAYGTLLGAVRHNGFIPWDDDIDIVMLRDDYNRLIELFNKNQGVYKCLSFEKQSFYLPYAKIVDTRTIVSPANFKPLKDNGIAVDIFPFDYVSNSIQGCENKKKIFRIWGKLLRYSLYNNFNEVSNSFNYKLIPYCVSRVLGTELISKVLLHHKMPAADTQTKYLLSYGAFLCGDPGVYEKEWFGDGSTLVFNNKRFPVPVNYDSFLKMRYGDYWILPPENERIQHSENAYYKCGSTANQETDHRIS